MMMKDELSGSALQKNKKASLSCLAEPVCLYFLLDMFDKTRSGRMDLFGFSALWDFMQRWRAMFQQYDRDRSGCISGMELQQGISVCTFDNMLRKVYDLNHFIQSYKCKYAHMSLSLLSPRSDGLQPQPPVFRDAGPALHRARCPTRHTAGPLHPRVHATSEHDSSVSGERHEHDGQHPPQL